MAKEKKSFFERLTGSKKINEDRTMNIISEEDEADTAMPVEDSFGAPADTNITEGDEGQLTIDVYQTDSDVVIKSTIAGVKPEDLDVAINNDMVTIKGERKTEEVIDEENYYYQECYWGSFSRSVVLPVDVLSEKAEASLKNGILTIRLPKASSNKAKKIQVRGF